MTSEPADAPDGEAMSIDATADALIAKHGGARAALKAVVAENEELKQAVAITLPVVSYGFTRGWHHRQ